MNFFKTTLLLVAIFLADNCKGQLTGEQKVKDFEYLFQTIKDNYPYFGRNIRQYQVDWLSNKTEYLRRVEETKTDSAFISVLSNVLKDLHSGHTNLIPTKYYEGYIGAYKAGGAKYNQWVRVLVKDSAKLRYWSQLLTQQESKPKVSSTKNKKKEKPKANCTFRNYTGGISAINIKSFSYFNIEKDTTKLYNFLSRLPENNKLIINIQGNGGGSSSYWEKYLVPRLIKKPSVIYFYSIVKKGKNNQFFFSDVIEKNNILSERTKKSRTPKELLDGSYAVSTSTDTIYPAKTSTFNGDIYLLVNKQVYSAAEWFASYCKQSGWATVVGEKTGGGRESDAALFALPESGIIVGYSALVGLNHDGSLSEESTTPPDLKIDASNAEDRLTRLIEFIRKSE